MQRYGRRSFAALALAGALAVGGACSDTSGTNGGTSSGTQGGMSGATTGGGATTGDGTTSGGSEGDLVSRGERIYNVNCIACHHRDPTQDGGLGPPVAGSSRELVEARVMRGEYPPGYTPRADTRLMIPLPHLEPELDALTAFLQSRAN